MHPEVLEFFGRVRQNHLDRFLGASVVEFGSLDINGSVRKLFHGGTYIGVDVGPGDGVDVVCLAHEFVPEIPVDVVVSTEMLEHDKYWQESLKNFVKVLRPGGLLIVTCATTGRGEHGTTRTSPADSPFTNDYYKNISEDEFKDALVPARYFNPWALESGPPGDLRFWGISRGV